MSEFLLELFKRRKEARQNEYVFSANSDTGHLIEPRKAMLKVAELSCVSFTVHDLRRTFVTIAESLEIPAYALKRLLNHNMNHDVTAGYIIMDVERLRKPMEQISNYLLRCMGVKQTAKVIMLQQGNEGIIEEQTG
jgi:integrase